MSIIIMNSLSQTKYTLTHTLTHDHTSIALALLARVVPSLRLLATGVRVSIIVIRVGLSVRVGLCVRVRERERERES
jgi:hypothetical protein